ncbi:stem-specific protein TSJT1-like [Aristolochia californica]|uniref:stem-specific protein TSJT1-like n=1 Tax=Aristolochia californica TaxID=171875 RepID=UPI0035DBE358
MFAVFEKSVAKPPEELIIPLPGDPRPKTRAEIAKMFSSSWPESTVCNLSNGNFMAFSHQNENPQQPRSIVVLDDVFCIFVGSLENICDLKRHYGLSRNTSEAMLVEEVYKVLRDRAPYPADQVIRDLVGRFAFVLFDVKYGTLFAARDRDGSINFNWGVAKDGSLVFSDDPKSVSEACGVSCGPFPQGCIFMNGSGLASFVHPMHKMRAIRREDDQGQVSSVVFQVDLYARLPSIPRVGSDANWANPTTVE